MGWEKNSTTDWPFHQWRYKFIYPRLRGTMAALDSTHPPPPHVTAQLSVVVPSSGGRSALSIMRSDESLVDCLVFIAFDSSRPSRPLFLMSTCLVIPLRAPSRFLFSVTISNVLSPGMYKLQLDTPLVRQWTTGRAHTQSQNTINTQSIIMDLVLFLFLFRLMARVMARTGPFPRPERERGIRLSNLKDRSTDRWRKAEFFFRAERLD